MKFGGLFRNQKYCVPSTERVWWDVKAKDAAEGGGRFAVMRRRISLGSVSSLGGGGMVFLGMLDQMILRDMLGMSSWV